MSDKNIFQRWIEGSPERARVLAQEEFIVDVSEAICEELERQGVSRNDLASKLGKSKSFVSQVLSGARNMTLRTLADIAGAIDMRPNIRLTPKQINWAGRAHLEIDCSHSKVPGQISAANTDWSGSERIRVRRNKAA